MSLGEIAAALGYSEASAFIRAFRRWSGRTPTAWRGAMPPQMTGQPVRVTAFQCGIPRIDIAAPPNVSLRNPGDWVAWEDT